MNVTEKLRTYRKNKEMTLTEAAAKLGVSQSTLQAWEAGTRDIPLEHVEKVCALFGAEPLDLLDKLPTLDEVDAILDKPLPERTYRESFIAAFARTIQKKIILKETKEVVEMYKALPEEMRKSYSSSVMKQSDDIRRQYDFIQEHRMGERLGSFGGELPRQLMDEYRMSKAEDESLVFVFHSLEPSGREMVLRVLDAALFASHRGFVNDHCLESLRDDIRLALDRLREGGWYGCLSRPPGVRG